MHFNIFSFFHFFLVRTIYTETFSYFFVVVVLLVGRRRNKNQKKKKISSDAFYNVVLKTFVRKVIQTQAKVKEK
jgi:hypothetical protein